MSLHSARRLSIYHIHNGGGFHNGGGLRAEADQFSTASTLINEELADTERGGR